ncbi:hypothetical protein AYI68_g4324 [Smittium mucronatum]|uniref:Uncharacterized protein n=1 Tax=Smittium mucronatum TaxID=133383 RepID=A0A1R0GXI9_9FUNG|nr:hypothetical protein AYI68_g4324 [Smittium mucronatum]
MIKVSNKKLVCLNHLPRKLTILRAHPEYLLSCDQSQQNWGCTVIEYYKRNIQYISFLEVCRYDRDYPSVSEESDPSDSNDAKISSAEQL